MSARRGQIFKPRTLMARRVRDLAPIEAAWVAGIIEGEGSIMVMAQGHRRRGAGVIVVMMTDEDVLLRLAQYIGAGEVRPVEAIAHPDLAA